MELEFKNQEELYKRVLPALKSKCNELKKYGYRIKEEDVWKYLATIYFARSHNLTLADVVSQIMHIDVNELQEFLAINTKEE